MASPRTPSYLLFHLFKHTFLYPEKKVHRKVEILIVLVEIDFARYFLRNNEIKSSRKKYATRSAIFKYRQIYYMYLSGIGYIC